MVQPQEQERGSARQSCCGQVLRAVALAAPMGIERQTTNGRNVDIQARCRPIGTTLSAGRVRTNVAHCCIMAARFFIRSPLR
jgi:hypothetical protein